MKRWMVLTLVFCVLLSTFGCTMFPADTTKEPTQNESAFWEEDGILKILMIGNSFTHDTIEYMWHIANNLGVESIQLANLYIGGSTIADHAKNAKQNLAVYEYYVNTSGKWTMDPGHKLLDVVRSDNWDVISLQQASKHSGLASTYNEDLEYMITFVRNLCPEAQLVWNMTWAYPEGSPNSGMVYYSYDNQLMYHKIVSAVQEKIVPDQRFSKIIPAGTAIQNASEAGYHKEQYRDDCHLSIPFGRYVAGLTMAATILDVSPENVTWAPAGLTQEQVEVAITAAEQAVETPFGVTRRE